MKICLVRHAIAVERGSPGYEDDGLRPLTGRGRARMVAAAEGLRRLLTPEAVLTSPLVRARETAAILADAFGTARPRTCEPLATGDHVALVAEISELDAGTIVCVGHEPHISGQLSFLLAGDTGSVAAPFRKGGAALVTCEAGPVAGSCWLEWMATPAMLRSIGSAPRH